MAHQKWNDDTDRSTLPIHGANTIGSREGGTKPDSSSITIFFVGLGTQAKGAAKRVVPLAAQNISDSACITALP